MPIPTLKRRAPDMVDLDGHAWVDGTAVEAYGVTVGVRVDDGSVLPLVMDSLPASWIRPEAREVDKMLSLRSFYRPYPGQRVPDDRVWEVFADAELLKSTLELETALDSLEGFVSICIGELAADWVFVHAGVVGWNGRAVILPGASHAGKTTLVAELLRRGATYYSDEFAVFDRAGRVHPFARPLGMRPAPGAAQYKVAPADFHAAVGIHPLPVGLIALCAYRVEAHWSPIQLSPAAAALELLPHALPVRHRAAGVIDLVERVVTSAPVYTGERGDAAEAAQWLIESVHRSG